MNDVAERNVFLGVSEILITTEPCRISTVLGSCVAIFLCDLNLGISAVCHARLPEPKAAHSSANKRVGQFCCVNTAVDHMMASLNKLGVDQQSLIVKAFGGSEMIKFNDHRDPNKWSVGKKNVEAVHIALRKYNLPLHSFEFGGLFGRKLHFHTSTGDVYVRPVGRKETKKLFNYLENFIFNG